MRNIRNKITNDLTSRHPNRHKDTNNGNKQKKVDKTNYMAGKLRIITKFSDIPK